MCSTLTRLSSEITVWTRTRFWVFFGCKYQQQQFGAGFQIRSLNLIKLFLTQICLIKMLSKKEAAKYHSGQKSLSSIHSDLPRSARWFPSCFHDFRGFGFRISGVNITQQKSEDTNRTAVSENGTIHSQNENG